MQASAELCNIVAGWFESVSKGDLSWVDHAQLKTSHNAKA
jgi:hypothetical protein